MKMRRKNMIGVFATCLFAAIGVLSVAFNAQSATITWTGQGVITDNTFLTLVGAVSNEVYGVDFAGAGAVTTDNNYTFDNFLSTGNFSIAGSPSSYTGWLNGQTSGDTNLDVVLNNADYGSISANPGTLNNLTIGQTYAVLVFLDDNRGSSAGGSYFKVKDGTAADSPVQLYGTYQSGTPGDPLGGYLLGTFTADATTQVLTVQNDNQAGTFDTGNAQYTGILLATAPSPVAPVPVLVSNIQPASVSVGVGEGATFSAAFSNTPPVSLQWQFSSGGATNNVSAANAGVVTLTNNGVVSSTLTFTNLQAANAGSYLLKGVNATNSAGVKYSSAAVLKVTPLIQWIQTGTFTDNTVLALAGPVANEAYGVDFAGLSLTTANNYQFDDYLASGNMSISTNGSAVTQQAVYLDGGGSTGDGNMDTILAIGVYGSMANTGTLHNLTVGQTYNVLVFLADTRTGAGAQSPGLPFYGTEGVFNGPAQPFVFPEGTNALGGYALGRFTAQSADEPLSVLTPNGSQYNGILLVKTTAPILPPIYVAANPQSATVAVGSNAVFTAAFLDIPPVNLQWQVIAGGATNHINAGVVNVTNNSIVTSTLTLPNVQLSDSGSSYVLEAVNATNSTDFAYTSTATLTVVQPITWVATGVFTDNSVLGLAGSAANEVYGVDFVAAAGNGSGPITTGNGYSFDDYSVGNMGIANVGGTGQGFYNAYLANGATTADGALDSILTCGCYGNLNQSGTLSNLTVGQTYTVLVLLDDTRIPGAPQYGQVTGVKAEILDGVSQSPAQAFVFSNGVPAVGGFFLGTFKAVATTQPLSVANQYSYPVGDQTYATNWFVGSDFVNSQYNAVLVTTGAPNPPTAPVLAAPMISNGNLILSGSGGTHNVSYTWLSTTNLTPPVNWTVDTNGTMDASGSLSNAIPMNAGEPTRFFRLSIP